MVVVEILSVEADAAEDYDMTSYCRCLAFPGQSCSAETSSSA